MLLTHFICGVGLEIDCTCFHGIMKCWKQLILLIISKLGGQVILYLVFWQHTGYQYPKNKTK
jgi:Na+/H+ antiporter NhaA